MTTKLYSFRSHRRHLLIVVVLIIAFTTAFIMRSYPVKYGFYLNEFDPYFNFRATKYLLDNGINAYLKWHDTMSWYPEGRNVVMTSQVGLHILTAFLYSAFGHGISLLDFTIILPLIFSSLTSVIIFALVRTISGSHGTTAGMFAALLFAFSPILIQRGNLGWFKSEPFGLFFGLLTIYLFLSAIKRESKEEASAATVAIEYKYNILKAIIAGLVFGLGNASWGGTQYFSIPIALFMIALPFVRKRKEDRKENIKFRMYVAALFTICTLLSTAAFPRTGISSAFGLSSIALLGGLVFLAIANYAKEVSQPKNEIRNLFFLLVVFLAAAIAVIAGGLYYSPPNLVKYLDAINPFVSYLPIIEIVAENSPPNLADYLRNFSTLLVLSGIGVWVILKRSLSSGNDLAIFALIIGISGIYVSTGSVRLLVFASIGVIILAAIGLEWITRLVQKTGELPSPGGTTKTTTRKLIKIKRKRFEVSNKRTVRFVYTLFIISFLSFPMVYPIDTNWITLADIPPTIVNGGTSYRIKTNDWINALDWISNNTPKDAVIAAWWDYGYWITVLANRTTLADNATLNETRIATIAQMFMDKPLNGINLAAYNLRADYILVYVVAQPILIDNNTYYMLDYGGDESKTPVFMTMAGLDEQKYIKENGYTTEFWNSTLIGKLIPFTRVGYTSFIDEKPTNIFKDYMPGAFPVYSKDIKYPKNGMSNEEALGLVYSSDSFNNINPEIISAVLIYEIIR
jgi:dolichyl-diphosphooligosaccharide---protein glycosyltransferase